MDYIEKCVDWREHKLEILRDLIGTPVVKNVKTGPERKLAGGVRWITNLIHNDPENAARFSSLGSMVPERWKFSFFLAQLVHKDDAKRVQLDCADMFPAFNEFANKTSAQMKKELAKQPGSSAKKKRSKTDDGAYSPSGGQAKGTPHSAKGKKEPDEWDTTPEKEEEEIEEDLEVSEAEDEESVAEPTALNKVSVGAVTKLLRAIGSVKCTLPFEAQLGAIKWMTENSFMTVAIKPEFRQSLGNQRKPIPLTDFPEEISAFVDAAFKTTVLEKEEEATEIEALRTSTAQKEAGASLDLGSGEQQDRDRMEQPVKTGAVVPSPRTSRHQDADSRVANSTLEADDSLAKNIEETPEPPATTNEAVPAPENKGSGDAGSRTKEAQPKTDGSPARRPEETHQMSADHGDRQAEKRKRGSDAKDSPDEEGGEVALAERKKKKHRGAKDSDKEAVSPEQRGKRGVRTRSAQKQKEGEDEDDKDGAESGGGERAKDQGETRSNSRRASKRTNKKGTSPAAKSGNK